MTFPENKILENNEYKIELITFHNLHENLICNRFDKKSKLP